MLLRKNWKRFAVLALVASITMIAAPIGLAREHGRRHVSRSVFVRPGFGFGVGYYRPFGFYRPYGYYGAYGDFGPSYVHRDGRYGLVDFNVEPQKSDIYVDGVYIGIADDYNGYPQKASLTPGKHHIKVVSPRGRVEERDIYVMPARELNFNLKFPRN